MAIKLIKVLMQIYVLDKMKIVISLISSISFLAVRSYFHKCVE